MAPRPGDVPVYIIRDRNLLAETPYFFFITALGDILESEAFTKALRSMPAQVRRAWHERKQMLATNVREAGGHFEALQGKLKGFWSVRVSGQYRVLLQPENGHWRAIKIGTHDEVYR